jgi:hypothetical protein
MSAIVPTVGSLTVTDPNLETMRVFWNGRRLEHLLSLGVSHTDRGARRTVIRVVNPAKVAPPLSESEQIDRQQTYDAMAEAGILVQKV